MTALAVPGSWLEQRVRVELRRLNALSTAADPIGPGRQNGALKEAEPGSAGAVLGLENGASNGDARAAVRRGARALHAACAELLPGYSAASREPWRQALLTAGCLDARPRRPLPPRAAASLIVEDVVQPSDVLCALWLARRSGLFSPGSPCGDGVGLRSACEIVPSFAATLAEDRRAEVLEELRANAAWRAHRLARTSTQGGAAIAPPHRR
jgi:hypothetical protein